MLASCSAYDHVDAVQWAALWRDDDARIIWARKHCGNCASTVGVVVLLLGTCSGVGASGSPIATG